MKIVDRIRKRISVDPETRCWLWNGAVDRFGYGRILVNGINCLAHRVSYQAIRGPIKKGMTVDHLCRVRDCVNPGHMEVVTNRENVLRGIGPSAIHARQIHAQCGHPFDGIRSDGHRKCSSCTRKRAAEKMRKRRRHVASGKNKPTVQISER